MSSITRYNDAVRWYLDELGSEVVAQSGTPSDRHHIGKMTLQAFKDAPDYVLQIDGSTGKTETFGSTLKRSTRCASCFRNIGLQTEDVIAIVAPNHFDIGIPVYAALYLGIQVSPVDCTLGIKELQNSFRVTRPKVIFCQSKRAPDMQLALNDLDLNAQIVTFDKGDYLCSFQEFMHKYGDHNADENFRACCGRQLKDSGGPSDFDPEKTVAFLMPTSGTTGLPKSAATTHKNLLVSMPTIWALKDTFPTPTRLALIASPLQWLTAILGLVMSPILRYTRLQTPLKIDKEHFIDLVNTYKPSWTTLSPTFLTSIIKSADFDRCDLTCFDTILLGGSPMPVDLIDEIKRLTPNTDIFNVYGMTEITSVAFTNCHNQPYLSSGRPLPSLKYRLIDTLTGEDIDKPNVGGELWLKGPGIFKEYFNNPVATAETFAEDRWFKTGDMFYRDENDLFYFVERIKLLMKYKGYQISPIELEAVIRQHPKVMDVAVTGLPDPECGDLPVACVVLKEGCNATAQEIKEIVAENLSDPKQLRGGVVFMDSMPMTATSKVHRQKIREIIQVLPRQ